MGADDILRRGRRALRRLVAGAGGRRGAVMADRRSRPAALTRRPGTRAAVLVCTHNDETTIAGALDSALDQTARTGSYRVVVVDDGSTDGTSAILRRYARAGVE